MDSQVSRKPAFLRGIVIVLLVLTAFGPGWLDRGYTYVQDEEDSLPPATSSSVTIERTPDGSFLYLVNGSPEVLVGMGYNPIYRYLPDDERAANYDRDFRLLCRAGVNHILGWDTDRGYEQDKFDELTLDRADAEGLGVVMPFYLPPEGDYQDPLFLQSLLDAAAAKVARFKDHPALRMWGVGNEVLDNIVSSKNRAAFVNFYAALIDQFHSLDPNHPVIYRSAEDIFIPALDNALRSTGQERPWLLFGVNVYTQRLDSILSSWPARVPDRAVVVSEFGAYAPYGERGVGYTSLWRSIRAYPGYVLGGAAYAWTTEGPEPTDRIWGLLDGHGESIDETFDLLSAEWLQENGGPRRCN
ncbi:MAG: hypothetical protein EPO21_19730 [Chloroflexota bacterium]|nr:MAG: hypothetical protein EPO21_19730 [Chloroflexota bacterium]